MRSLVITEHGPPEVLRVKERPDPRPAPGDALTEWVEQGSIRPVVAKEFPLEEGAAAHRYLHDRNNIGKVVLIM